MNMSEEARLASKIDSRSLTQSDISFIVQSGDSHLKRHLDRKMNEIYQEKKHINRLYGSDFDYRKKNGDLVKPLGTYDV